MAISVEALMIRPTIEILMVMLARGLRQDS